MDECSGKKAIDRVIAPQKGMTRVFRDNANTRQRSGQLCSRLNCSSRTYSPKGIQISGSEKGKSLRPSIRSSCSSKDAVGSSALKLSSSSNTRNSLIEPRKRLSSRLETDSSETSSVHDETETSGFVPPPEKLQRELQAKLENIDSGNVMVEVGSSNVVSNTRTQRNFHLKPGLQGQEAKSTGPVTHGGTSKYGLRNFKCNSISDVIPASCSSTDSSLNKRKDAMKKRNCEGESSCAARGKKMNGSLLEVRNSGARNGISISDSRSSRNMPSHRENNAASVTVRTRRSISGPARGRLSGQRNENPVSPNDSSVRIQQVPYSGDLNAPALSHHSISETSLSCPRSFSISSTGSEQSCGLMPSSSPEYGITHSLNHDGLQRYNMGGIAEVLVALERIEQDEELSHEQILLLETNLLLNGLNFYDQHRDMRLDIDNMSYEELLALEERMGSVSTALTEDELSKCLVRSIYQSPPTDGAPENCNDNEDDIKCSICQEEYFVGDEVGSVQCKHKYHAVCIQQWLRLKNWCPICKASVAPSDLCS